MTHRSLILAACLGVSNALLAAESVYHFTSVAGPYRAERVMSGLGPPSAIQFLPGGDALVLQRNPGLMTRVNFDSGKREDIVVNPDMLTVSDAGLHDVELHPGYADNGWIYVSYSEGPEYYSTLVLDRIRLAGTQVSERERLFTADAYSEDPYHYGGRIQFQDGYLFLTIGDRHHQDRAQDRSQHAGSIVRLHDDGRVPEDNPFVGMSGGENPARPEIWSYGHRNPQGLFVDPRTGQLWENEHGPRGGDELNRVVRGANYGWPVISYGFEYDGGPIGRGIVREEGMEQPVWVYVPSIAPSDLVIYQGAAFPGWQNSFLIGALAQVHLNRLVLVDGRVVLEERLVNGQLGRIRSIAVDEAGYIYLGSDTGDIWRLRPD